MATFPRREANVTALGERVLAGLKRAPEDYPAPPIAVSELKVLLDAFNESRAAAVAADAVAKGKHMAKDKAFRSLVNGLKTSLRYAEAVTRGSPAKLRGLGWGPPRRPKPLAPPGQVLGLAGRAEAPDRVILEWRAPFNGGAPAAYTIQRRKRGGKWEEAGTSVHLKQVLTGQAGGAEMEFRVIAVNKTGAGSPSALARVVL